MSLSDDPSRPESALLFISPTEVPERWRARARAVTLLSLLPDEAAALLEGTVFPSLDPQDESLVRLVASGLPTSDIARRAHLTERAVQRRLEALRERFSVASNVELASLLARHGFALENSDTDRSEDRQGSTKESNR